MAEIPEALAPYVFHGLDLDYTGKDEVLCECPFCDRPKFSVNVETGVYRCLVCAEGTERGGGNKYIFLRHLWELGNSLPTDYNALSEDRGILETTFKAWGLVKSPVTGDWLLPGYGTGGELNQLYKYVRSNGRMLLMPTPTCGHQMFGVPLYDAAKPVVYLCEGPWDGMVLWETLGNAKLSDGRWIRTAGSTNGLELANVLAVSSCGAIGTAFEKFAPLFHDKEVRLMFDSDHPYANKAGTEVLGAGRLATERAAGILMRSGYPPSSIRWIKWGEGGVDLSKPSGYDVRDYLHA